MKKNFTTPTPKNVLDRELTKITLAREWRGLEIHFVKKQNIPKVIAEVNRISTIMFNLDILDSDVFDETYTYIVVYDRINGEIVSFYRYIFCKDAIYSKQDIRLSTAKYFSFSNEFIENILSVTIEFGRSVVNKTAKNHFIGLQAVWIGLGVLLYEYYFYPKDTKIEYFFGKFSLQWNVYNEATRDKILYLYQKYFPPLFGIDKELYIKPLYQFQTQLDFTVSDKMMCLSEYKANRKILLNYLISLGLSMPKLVETYANIGGLHVYGTIDNESLKSWETAILETINQIQSGYIKRFVDGYIPINPSLFV